MDSAKTVEILLVEDNPGDVLLTQKALLRGKVANRLTVAKDGEEAMAILRHAGGHQRSARPDLILLDLNLPKKDGREVLAEIKGDPDLRRIPVVVLTSSQAEEDVLRTYDLHASGYITKPVDMEQFAQVVKALEDFWFQVVRLPGRE
jgi:two-component system, chemotaxis family, response regulator Rcp1